MALVQIKCNSCNVVDSNAACSTDKIFSRQSIIMNLVSLSVRYLFSGNPSFPSIDLIMDLPRAVTNGSDMQI